MTDFLQWTTPQSQSRRGGSCLLSIELWWRSRCTLRCSSSKGITKNNTSRTCSLASIHRARRPQTTWSRPPRWLTSLTNACFQVKTPWSRVRRDSLSTPLSDPPPAKPSSFQRPTTPLRLDPGCFSDQPARKLSRRPTSVSGSSLLRCQKMQQN